MQVLIAISGFCGFCSRIGNTPCTTPFDFLFVISIHVPAWGTTADVSKTDSTFQKDFNPRSRVGNDADLSVLRLADAISIHVPAWGTTDWDDYFSVVCIISIHVPAWGTTATATVIAKKQDKFQSTFPRGERRNLV